MTEDNHRRWDISLKAAGICGAVFLFFYGFSEYERNRRDAAAVEFWKQQFPIYQELCEVAAAIPATTEKKRAGPLKESFWTLYYGHARMVTDAEVHKKLSIYAYQLKLHESGMSTSHELQYAAYDLSTACRRSMALSWNVSLSDLETEVIK